VPLDIAQNRKQLQKIFAGYDDHVRGYFAEFGDLVDSRFSLEVLLAYCFFRLEQGQRMALYCGARRLHKTDSDLTWQGIEAQHLTREAFRRFFANIYGVDFPNAVQDVIEPAEAIRDRLMHGRGLDEAETREAICRVLFYASEFNAFLQGRGVGFRPFGDLRGFVGRLEALDKPTSRWILKGMGFSLA
jgi:hypothetical protein